MERKVLMYILVSIIAVGIAIILYLLYTTLSSNNFSVTTGSTFVSSQQSTPISCQPGEEPDPVTGQCSPIIPASMVVQPSPSIPVNLWLALNLASTTCMYNGYPILTNPYTACLGTLNSSTCPTNYQCDCKYCNPVGQYQPTVANTSGTSSFYVQVLSSNGTPVPNVQLKISSPLPTTNTFTLTTSTPFGNFTSWTINITYEKPSTLITTGNDGRAYIKVNWNADLTYVNWATLLGISGPFNYNYTFPPLTFNIQIVGSDLTTSAVASFPVTVCGYLSTTLL